MAQEKQMRFTDDELSVIKNTFVDNNELLKVIRKVVLQSDLTVDEFGLLQNIKDKPEVLKILRKSFLPILDFNAPFGQMADLWMFTELKGKSPDDAFPEMMARDIVIKYLDQQLSIFEGNSPENILKLSDLLPKELSYSKTLESYVNLYARNMLITHTDTQLIMFQVLAGQANETVEETKKRLAKDSSK